MRAKREKKPHLQTILSAVEKEFFAFSFFRLSEALKRNVKMDSTLCW